MVCSKWPIFDSHKAKKGKKDQYISKFQIEIAQQPQPVGIKVRTVLNIYSKLPLILFLPCLVAEKYWFEKSWFLIFVLPKPKKVIFEMCWKFSNFQHAKNTTSGWLRMMFLVFLESLGYYLSYELFQSTTWCMVVEIWCQM